MPHLFPAVRGQNGIAIVLYIHEANEAIAPTNARVGADFANFPVTAEVNPVSTGTVVVSVRSRSLVVRLGNDGDNVSFSSPEFLTDLVIRGKQFPSGLNVNNTKQKKGRQLISDLACGWPVASLVPHPAIGIVKARRIRPKILCAIRAAQIRSVLSAVSAMEIPFPS